MQCLKIVFLADGVRYTFVVVGKNSIGFEGFSEYTLMRGLAPSGGSCVLSSSGDEGSYNVRCDGFENSNGPISYAIGVPVDNISSSDILQFPPVYLNSQQIELSGGVLGSDSRLFVTISGISGVAAQVKTNIVHLPPETNVRLLGRVLNAGRQLDFLSVISLSVTIFRDTNLTAHDGLQVLSVMDKTVRELSGRSPSTGMAKAVLESLYFASRWAVQAKVRSWQRGLEIMAMLIIWLTRMANLSSSPMTQMQIIRCSELANNIYIIWENRQSDSQEVSALITTALSSVRTTSLKAGLLSWSVDQPFMRISNGDGFAFKKTPAELEGASFSISTEYTGQTSVPVHNVVSFSGLLLQFSGGEKNLVSVVIYKAHEPQLAPAHLAIITALVTVDLSMSSSHGTSTTIESSLILTRPIVISLVYNTTNYSPEIQRKIVSDRLIRCVWWSVNETSGGGEWVDTGCSLETIQSSEDLSGQFIGIGTVHCSCSQPATFAAELDLSGISILPISVPTVSLVRWDPDTPNNLDELVVAAGEELKLKIVAFSITETPWKSNAAAAAAPSSLVLTIGSKIVGDSESSGVWVSLPDVVETSIDPQYFQRTAWILTLSSAWTLAFSGNMSNHREQSIHALLSGETSGDKTRAWTMRILDCEILVGRDENLNFISARFRTSPRLIFAINPFLAQLGNVQAPTQPTRAQWTCSSGRYCSNEIEKLAGGIRLKIGRKIRVLGNASVVQQIRQMGGSLVDVAGRNPGLITSVTSSGLVVDLNLHAGTEAAEICVVLHDEAIC
jgi:hypothetical protein